MDNSVGSNFKEHLNRLLSLPIELLVHIVSFLSAHDLVKLRYVSRRLRSVCETPSLWREFIWPHFNIREEHCVKRALESFGQYVQRLSFGHHVTPFKLEAILRHCSNLVELRLSTESGLSCDQLEKAIRSMGNLQILTVSHWTDEIYLLLMICNRLKKLTVMMDMLHFHEVLTEWAAKGFIPSELNIISTNYFHPGDLRQLWLSLNSNSSTAHTSYFKVYARYKVPMNLSPSLPDFQLQFGQSCTLPFVRASTYGLLGLEVDLLLLTNCTYACGRKTLYKATTVYEDQCGFDTRIGLKGFDTIIQRSDLNRNIYSLAFITHFDASHSKLQSGHLEQLAMACRNLLELNLKYNTDCLKSLQGLRVIAACCQNLRGLNLLFISAKDVESLVQLWEILVKLKLIYLAIDTCVLFPCQIDEQNKTIIVNLYQKCSNLKALEFTCCDDCRKVGKVGDCLLLSQFPSLVHLFAITFTCSAVIRDIVSSCAQLKFFIYSSDIFDSSGLPALNCNLEQIHFDMKLVDIPATFMDSISAHGGLVHVVMKVRSVTGDGVTALIENSPKLITCHIKVEHINASTGRLLDFSTTLKKKFYNRKLFSCGGFSLSRQYITDFMIICINSELTSVWSRDSCHRDFRLEL